MRGAFGILNALPGVLLKVDELVECKRQQGVIEKMSSQTKLGFLICPVRNGFDATAIVERLEAGGWKIHYPRRDTPQNDPVGLNICRTNRAAISRADRVFIVWDGKSEGSLFDFGIAFALDKPITVIEAPARTDAKSFQNVMRALEMEQAARHAQEH